MATINNNSFIFDFLTQTRFSVWRHVIFILLFLPIALSMSFSVFSEHVDVLGGKVWLYGVCLAGIPVSFVYFNLKVLIPRYFAKNNYRTYVASFLLCIVLFLSITYLTEYLILASRGISMEFTVYVLLDGLSDLTLYVVCIAGSSITAMLQQWARDTGRIDDLENAWLRSNLDELKNRINPEFLYGVLAYASETVRAEPEKVSATLLRLSKLLRYELYDCKRERVLMRSDLSFIENYLSLEQQNAGNNFVYNISTVGDSNFFIAPFLFMPFIQEIMKQKPSDLRLSFDFEDNLIRFTVNVADIDLLSCDFQKVEQRFTLFYGRDFSINRDIRSLAFVLNKTGADYE
ncbi:MAG: histidine kinase [Tannerellaceae bacterium]|nr:histidine kinase [Tannerellaceae bacterium]